MTGTRKPRVAVVFGGRSSEHADLVRHRRQRARPRSTATRYDVVPIGIATDGRWVLESGDPDRLRDRRRRTELPSVDGGPRGGRADPGTDGDRPGRAPSRPSRPRRPSARSTWSSRCCTDRGARTAPSRGCSRWPASATSAPACSPPRSSMDKAYMKVVLRPAGLPVHAGSHGHRPRVGRATPRPCRERASALGYPVFVKPARGGSSIGISKAHDASRARRGASRRRTEHDPKVLVEVVGGGCARDRVRRARRPSTARPRRSVPAEIRVSGDHEFYDFEAKYLPEEHDRARRPGRPRPTTSPTELRALAGPRLRGGRLRGPGPGRLLRDARRVAGDQRDQHDAGLHADCRCSRRCGPPPASTTRRSSTG